MATHVPFNRPSLVGRELEYMAEAARSRQLAGDGQFTRRCHALLEEQLSVAKALLTTSCTHALEMAALLLRIGPGDEVILPAFTFVSTANAFVLRGARPVFADVRKDTLNLDESGLEALLSARTRAIVPVHYAGVGCEMDVIGAIARVHGLKVVEDNAQGLFARYRGRWLGTLGDLATLSFHETKNFTCGEGGALLINRPEYAEQAEIIREKGTDRSRFLRGQVDKYTWVEVGSSYLPADLLAAFLLAQLEARDRVTAGRRELWQFYWTELASWANRHGVGLPVIPPHCDPPHHMFYLLMPSAPARDRLIEYLKGRGIVSAFHYVPLHLSRMGRRFGGAPGQCPVTEDVSGRLVRLPFYTDMSEDERAIVVEAIHGFSV